MLCRILHTMDVIVALMFDELLRTARFLEVKHKTSRTRVYTLVLDKNAFPIYRFPSRSLHPWVSPFLRPVGSKPDKLERFRKRCCKDSENIRILTLIIKKNKNC